MWPFRPIRRAAIPQPPQPTACPAAAEPSPEAGPRAGVGGILIVASCTGFMLHGLMQLLTDRHRVSWMTSGDLKARCADEAATAALFSGFDVVFVETGGNGVQVPPSVADRVVTFPPVFFYGLHPDLVYVWVDGKPVQGPLGDYHSSIALYGFRHGMTPERVASLFRRDTYEALGFFGMFEESFDHYLGLARAEGFDMRTHLVGWLRRGAFMHSVNHPKSFVLQDVARELLARFDPEGAREAADRDVSELMPDFLANGAVFPVYPELGLRLGIRGEYLFKPAETPRRLALEEFVAGSHAAYRAVGADRLTCSRVEEERYARLLDLA